MESSHRGFVPHSRCVVADPIATRTRVRIATGLENVGFEDADATGPGAAELLLADVDPTRSLVGERVATQSRPLLK